MAKIIGFAPLQVEAVRVTTVKKQVKAVDLATNMNLLSSFADDVNALIVKHPFHMSPSECLYLLRLQENGEL